MENSNLQRLEEIALADELLVDLGHHNHLFSGNLLKILLRNDSELRWLSVIMTKQAEIDSITIGSPEAEDNCLRSRVFQGTIPCSLGKP
jgi:hypothetical protein